MLSDVTQRLLEPVYNYRRTPASYILYTKLIGGCYGPFTFVSKFGSGRVIIRRSLSIDDCSLFSRKNSLSAWAEYCSHIMETSSFVNSTEYRKHVDFVLKEELGEIHVNIPEFFDTYFGNIPQLTAASQALLKGCKRGDNSLYSEEKGWRGWPELVTEKDVLGWLANIIAELVQLAEAQELFWKIDCRPLTQPSQLLQGSIAERKLNIGFVDDSMITEDFRYHWSQILMSGELKNDLKYDRKSRA
ncbi:hypothetical protein RJZ90_006734 [Blastomyces dermatitidis]